MDSASPTLPPAIVAPATARPFAYGDGPRWTLAADRGALVLTLEGRAPVRLSNRGWQDTPVGRRLAMATADGRPVTLTITHGLCRSVPGAAPGAMIATVAIGEMRLRGCFDDRGSEGRVYPGG